MEGNGLFPEFRHTKSLGFENLFVGEHRVHKEQGEEIIWFDNESIWDEELPPGSIRGRRYKVAPVKGVTTPQQALGLEATVRLQNGRQFWLKGQGPGQPEMRRLKNLAFWLRDKFEKAAITLE